MGRLFLTLPGFLLTCLIALLFIAAQWGPPWLVWPWRVAGFVLVALIYLDWLINRSMALEVKWDFPEHIFLGTPAEFQCVFISPRGSSLACIWASTDSMMVTSAPRDIQLAATKPMSLSVSVLPLLPGKQTVGHLYVKQIGVFGLTSFENVFKVENQLEVMPERMRGGYQGQGARLGGSCANAEAGDGFELIRLRPYTTGDTIKRIDWKATARTGEKIVRVLSDDTQLDLFIMLDLSHFGNFRDGLLTRFSHYINMISRISERALASGDRVGLMTYGLKPQKLLPLSGHAGQLQLIRKTLQASRTLPQQAGHLAAYRRAAIKLPHRCLLLVLTHLDQVARTDHLLRTIKIASAKHLPLVASVSEQVSLSLMKQRPAGWRDPYVALASSQRIEAVERQIKSLRQQGATVLYNKPSLLDDELLNTYHLVKQRHRVR
jgi:uncharacterized protein (DUF58 family)